MDGSRQNRASFAYLAVLALPFVGAGYLLGRSFDSVLLTGLGVAIPVLGAAAAMVQFGRFALPIRRLELEDAERGLIQVLDISEAEPLHIPGVHSSVDPGFAVEFADGRTLVMMGPWLCEPETYGGTVDEIPDDEDALEAFANFLPPPYAFPTANFSVHRFPLSGIVVHIDIQGDYLHPRSDSSGIDLTGINGAASHLLECGLEDLGPVVASIARA